MLRKAEAETEYISIAQAAKVASISKQAIYQRLNKDLKPYLKVIDGKKCLDIAVLQVLIKADIQAVEQQIEKNSQVVEQEHLKLEYLQQELEQKNCLIKLLQEELKVEREHSRKQSDELTNLLKQVVELQRNNQVLEGQKIGLQAISEQSNASDVQVVESVKQEFEPVEIKRSWKNWFRSKK